MVFGRVKEWMRVNWFPDDEARFKKYMAVLFLIKAMTLIILLTRFSPTIASLGILGAAYGIYAVSRLTLTVMLFYIFYKGKVWQFMFKTIPCMFLSLLVMCITAMYMGPAAVLIFVGSSIYHNRKRFKMYMKYKQYTKYTIIAMIISVTAVALTWLGFKRMSGEEYIMFRMALSLFTLIPVFMLWKLLKSEIEGGRSFYEAIRIVSIMGIAFLLFLLGWMTVIPVKFLSDKSLLGDEDNDFFALQH
ncbi:hypothetical protein [Schwartzia sp. (in: firmicutes)]